LMHALTARTVNLLSHGSCVSSSSRWWCSNTLVAVPGRRCIGDWL
jgi:hypothetical protein